jgi:dinuclear metal center YbgI/SA1388 family protein
MFGCMNVARLVDFLDQLYPLALAEEWDNVGLIAGDPRAEVTGVMLAVDATRDVLEEARETGCNVVVSHHPPIFRPIKRIVTRDAQGEVLALALKNDIALVALHTNLDSARGGLNDTLCELLGLSAVRPLVDAGRERLYKLAVFVPSDMPDRPDAVARVREAMWAAGAGSISDYVDCSFNLEGRGTFRGLAGLTNPQLGEAGRLETASETRVEVILPRERAGRVIEAMKRAHPYEEVAYDLYPLHNKEPGTGLARIGRLEPASTLGAFVARLKTLGMMVTRVQGDDAAPVSKVALCSGAGSDFTGAACSAGADVYLTAEFKHHHGLQARHSGTALVEVEHWSLEHRHWPKLKTLIEAQSLKARVSERESLHWRHA